ncbi:MAG: amidase [Planctomycetota bacterium]|jgi:Asp-tRNA(Asn)/Glu-tRNA(Gln) amidotransferase A subunit family amidase
MSTPRASHPDRRSFLVAGGLAAAGTVLPASSSVSATPKPEPPDPPAEPGPAEDPITATTIEEAEKLAAVRYTPDERELIVDDIGDSVGRIRRRREFPLPNELAPQQVFRPDEPEPSLHPPAPIPAARRSVPAADEDIAFAPLTDLSAWIRDGRLRSMRLTEIYLDRLARHGDRLECVVTRTDDLARRQALRADAEIRDGRWRGPLHGIPWGAKDLLDTAGIRTTWGATPYRERVPDRDAAVVEMLDEAGAVLVAKLTLGALAYGDIWFDGKTRNPFNVEQGSSGSSAGSAAATAAGLVGFSIGTETLGSIVSPCMRCGTTGLRPTFSRVSRRGAMALCWSLDKIGPICRTVEDCAHVLRAITRHDPADPSSTSTPFTFDPRRGVHDVRLGYNPDWFRGDAAGDHDRRALDAARAAGMKLVEIDLPEWPYDALLTILLVEAAAAFEELTLDGRDDDLVWQEPQAWPNTFRSARFIPAIEYVQAERFRRRVAEMMAERFEKVDAIISPSYAASLLLITNCTGHPSLTLRTGFADDGTPRATTINGRLFDEGTLCAIGMAIERELGVWDRRPELA